MSEQINSSNGAPQTVWFAQEMAGRSRRRLYVNGLETPFFIDTATRASHRTSGSKHGLYGSGMSPKGFAAVLASGPRIEPLKHRAEQMAMSA